MLIFANDILLDSREFGKLFKICQKNSTKLDAVLDSQERIGTMLNDQKLRIDEIKSRLDKLEHHDTEIEMSSKMKGKNKGKKSDEFYNVNIHILVSNSLRYFSMLFLLIITCIIGCN